MKTRKYLTVLLSVFSVLPILLVMGGSMLFFGRNASNGMQGNLESIAKLNAENVGQFYSQRKMALEVATDLPEIRRLIEASNAGKSGTALETDRAGVNEIFRQMTQRQSIQDEGSTADNYVRRSVLVNREGYVIASDDPSVLSTFSRESQTLRSVVASGFFVSDIMQDPDFIQGKKYFNISVPIYRNGVYEGFIQSAIDMYYFDLISRQTIGNTGRTLVIDSSGGIAADDVLDSSGKEVVNLAQLSSDSNFYRDTWKSIDLKKKPSGSLNYRENDREKSGYYSGITGTSWVIFSSVPQSELLDPMFMILRYYGGAILIFAAFLIFISNIAARRFLNPMRALSTAFMRLKQRDYSIRLPGCYKGEFGEIASSFNQLAERIEEDTEELKVSEARYALIMEETNQVIFEWDILENHLYHTVHWTNKFGFGLSVENPGKKIPEFSPVHPEDRSALVEFFAAARRGIQPKPIDVRMKTIRSNYIWCTVSMKVIFDTAKTPFRAIGLISDTDHKKKIIEKLETRTKMDLLTQLYNKVTTEAMIEEFLSSSPLEEQHGFIILDIDNFKGINDTLGHIYGDSVLKKVSVQLKSLFRSTDIVGRAGGDEFVILVKEVPDRSVLVEKLGEICTIFRNSCTGEMGDYHISASVGAALFPSDGQTFSELYQHADAALYRSKKAGKDRYCFYCEGTLKQSS